MLNELNYFKFDNFINSGYILLDAMLIQNNTYKAGTQVKILKASWLIIIWIHILLDKECKQIWKPIRYL